MAVCEQLIFGFRLDGSPGRDVLACSPGLEPECAREVVALCEGWGRVPGEGVRRAVTLSWPLEARLGSITGRLHAVVRIGTGLKPLYHALVLAQDDFAEYGHDPFAVAREFEFADLVLPGQILARCELPPPPSSPPADLAPERRDHGFVDEALRQLLVNRRLELPLETGSEESDRFLNLLLCCLPGPLRRDLRFASWTPGGRNACALAAVQRDAAFFRAWRPYLMSLPLGQLTPSAEEYVAQVRGRLEAADLAGLAQISEGALVELGVRVARSGTLAATVPPPEDTVRKAPLPPRPPRPVIADRRSPARRDFPRTGARSRPALPRAETSLRHRLCRPGDGRVARHRRVPASGTRPAGKDSAPSAGCRASTSTPIRTSAFSTWRACMTTRSASPKRAARKRLCARRRNCSTPRPRPTSTRSPPRWRAADAATSTPRPKRCPRTNSPRKASGWLTNCAVSRSPMCHCSRVRAGATSAIWTGASSRRATIPCSRRAAALPPATSGPWRTDGWARFAPPASG